MPRNLRLLGPEIQSAVTAIEAKRMAAPTKDAMKSAWKTASLPDAVVRLVREKYSQFRDPAVLMTISGPILNGFPQRGGNRRPAHLRLEPCFRASALMSETNRSTSHISPGSASCPAVKALSWLRVGSSCARANADADGRNSRSSPAVGWRARNEITSGRKPEEPDQPPRDPRAMISPNLSCSGSGCRASLSGISIVNCIISSLTGLASNVQHRGRSS